MMARPATRRHLQKYVRENSETGKNIRLMFLVVFMKNGLRELFFWIFFKGLGH